MVHFCKVCLVVYGTRICLLEAWVLQFKCGTLRTCGQALYIRHKRHNTTKDNKTHYNRDTVYTKFQHDATWHNKSSTVNWCPFIFRTHSECLLYFQYEGQMDLQCSIMSSSLDSGALMCAAQLTHPSNITFTVQSKQSHRPPTPNHNDLLLIS